MNTSGKMTIVAASKGSFLISNLSNLVQHIPLPTVSLLPSTNTTISLKGTSSYHIPTTKITLHLTSYDRLVSFSALKQVVSQVGIRAKEHIEKDGDGWLSTADDPFSVEVPGCSFFAKSNPSPGPPVAPERRGRREHLTYGILVSVAAGLWQWMLIRDHLNMVKFEIEDSTRGILGMGSVTPH